MLRLLPTFRGPKIVFSFTLLSWIQIFNPTFPFKKKILKSLKALELYVKTYFEIKVDKSGMCHNLERGRVCWGNFGDNRSSLGSFKILFAYFVCIAHFTKFTCGSSLPMEKSLLLEKSKAEESPAIKKKKGKNRRKKRAQRREKKCHSVKKRKIIICESDWYWQSSTLP